MISTLAVRSPIERHRYGKATLWTLHRNLEGSTAHLLGERIELHFSEIGSSLIVDLSGLGWIDSVGTSVLERSLRAHTGLVLAGRPRCYPLLPVATRWAIDLLGSAASLEGPLKAHNGLPHADDVAELRSHHRIPLQMPVELYFQGMSTAAFLHDVSFGGSRIGRLPQSWQKKLKAGGETTDFRISLLERDPFGSEILQRFDRSVITAAPVHFMPQGTGLGARFFIGPHIGPDADAF